MKADRLLAVLMLLQARGRVTAREVAQELEVSERTARRDLDALGVAGLPIVAYPGRNGGWELLGGGRTDLSGLSASEAVALFVAVGGAGGASGPAVQAALRKLTAALPEPIRARTARAARSVVVDPRPWGLGPVEASVEPPWLAALQDAVIEAEQIELVYVDRRDTPTTRVAHPLGLASKAGRWYLVADTARGRRMFRVDRVRAVRRLGVPAARPPGFAMADVWREMADAIDEHRGALWVSGQVDPDYARWLTHRFGQLVRLGAPGTDGWLAVELAAPNLHLLFERVVAFGTHLRVVGPPELSRALAEMAATLAAHLAAGADAGPDR